MSFYDFWADKLKTKYLCRSYEVLAVSASALDQQRETHRGECSAERGRDGRGQDACGTRAGGASGPEA